MLYLPSKNFIIPVTTLLAITMIFWGISALYNAFLRSPDKDNNLSGIQKTLAGAVISQDSDNDGLKDWEEQLWKTDPKKPDTDGDGALDGDEVSAARDPLLSGPNDLLENISGTPSGNKTPTLGDELIQDFISSYLIARGITGDEALNNDQKVALVSVFGTKLLSEVDAISDIYTEKDIIVSLSRNSKEYLNELAATTNRSFRDLNGSQGAELGIVQNALSTQNMQKIQELKKYISGYQALIEYLKKDRVPSAFVSAHTKLLNASNNLMRADQAMLALETDPVQAMIGLKIYEREVGKLIEWLKLLKTKIDEEKIIFSSSDSGSLFYKYFRIQLIQ